jgi:hypothetical protein
LGPPVAHYSFAIERASRRHGDYGNYHLVEEARGKLSSRSSQHPSNVYQTVLTALLRVLT